MRTAMGLDDQGGRGAEHANCGMRMGEDDAVETRLQSWSKEDSAVPMGAGTHVVNDGGGIDGVGVGVLRKDRDETVSLRTGGVQGDETVDLMIEVVGKDKEMMPSV
jgi:hypothetical protein